MASIGNNKFVAAGQFFQAGRLEEAENLCRQIVATSSRFAPGFYLLGLIAVAKRDHDLAARSFRRAITQDSTNPEYWLALGRLYYEQRRYTDLYEIMTEGVTAHPDNVGMLVFLGGCYVRRGEVTQAIETLNRALTLSPHHPTVLSDLALMLLDDGSLERAAELAERARRVQPNENGAIISAQALTGLGRLDAALDVLSQTEATVPDSRNITAVENDIRLYAALKHRYTNSRDFDAPFRVNEYIDRIREALPSQWSPDLTVVFFHVAQDNSHPAIQSPDTDYNDLLNIAAKAARRARRNVSIVLITDLETTFRTNGGADLVIRLPVKREWIMYERMRTQRAFLSGSGLIADTLFIDSDVVLNREFDSIFDRNFDIGLTWRTSMPWAPINGGMILARKNRGYECVRFFDACLAFYEDMISLPCMHERYNYDIRQFQGDQFAIAAYLEWQTPPLAPTMRVVDGVTISFFPCHELNRTFDPELAPAVLEKTYALHFKGARKHFVRQYVERRRLDV